VADEPPTDLEQDGQSKSTQLIEASKDQENTRALEQTTPGGGS